MAIESVPAPVSSAWDPETSLIVPTAARLNATPAAMKPGAVILEEAQPASRDSTSATSDASSRASIFGAGGALSVSPLLPSSHRPWSGLMVSALECWQTWELPLPASHPFWSPASTSEPLPKTPRLQHMAIQAGGLSPSLLALFATMPPDSVRCQAVSSQLYCFLLWDTWLKRYGSKDEALALSEHCRSLGSSPSDSPEASFPPRLGSKYPLKKEGFLRSLDQLFCHDTEGGSQWRREYMGLWALYAKDGLELHHKMSTMSQAKQTADSSQFLLYRALSSNFPQLALLAAKNVLPSLPDTLTLDAICPLLALGAMIVATYSDLLLASRLRSDASASVSCLDMFDDDWAVLVHNSLLTLFHEEAALLLKQTKARAKSSTFRSHLGDLVTIVQAVLHGTVLWYTTAPAFQKLPGASPLLQEDAASLAFSLTSLEAEAGCSVADIDIGSPDSVKGLLPSASKIPQWVAEAVDSAVDAFVQVLRAKRQP